MRIIDDFKDALDATRAGDEDSMPLRSGAWPAENDYHIPDDIRPPGAVASVTFTTVIAFIILAVMVVGVMVVFAALLLTVSN